MIFRKTKTVFQRMLNLKSQESLFKERKYSPKNYTPLPVVFSKAEGTKVWDADGNVYTDFNSSYSATNQGHNHPKIVNSLIKQAQKLSLPSRAFTHDLFGDFSEYVCQYFQYEKVLPLNGGAESIELAIKLSRSWGYTQKGIEQGKAKVLTMLNNYHGRTIGATSLSTNEYLKQNYGPFTPGIGSSYDNDEKNVHFNNLEELEEAFKLEGDNIASVLIESIQGEAGVIVPDKGYLAGVKKLCQKYNVLWIADEIQSGAGRTGKLLACDHDNVRPDVLIVAKSISGGMYPTSLVFSSEAIFSSMAPNTHGATFAGSPLSCAVTMTALQVLKDEGMIENAAKIGETYLIPGLLALKDKYPSLIKEVRGKGLFTAFDIDDSELPLGRRAWHLCMFLKSKGIICKTVHGNTIRWAPQLIISKEEIEKALAALDESLIAITNLELAVPEADIYESYYCY